MLKERERERESKSNPKKLQVTFTLQVILADHGYV
jgi:hypothetical protein